MKHFFPEALSMQCISRRDLTGYRFISMRQFIFELSFSPQKSVTHQVNVSKSLPCVQREVDTISKENLQ